MKHNLYYTAGVACGLLFGILAVAVICAVKKKRHTSCEFDERQQLIRGKAFTCGFTAILIYLLAYGILSDISGFSFEDNLTSNIIAVMIGLTVVVIICIWNDAYFALREKAKPFIILDILLMVTNFINAYRHLKHPENSLDPGYQALALALVFLCILVTMGLKTIMDKRHLEMEQ